MELVESVLKQVEIVIRGDSTKFSIDKVKLLDSAINLYKWSSSGDAASMSSNSDSAEREKFAAIAIKMHNKARNLTAENNHDLRGLLKATAAWLLLHFSKQTIGSFSTIVKLLARAGGALKEFRQFRTEALQCCIGATNTYTRMSTAALEKGLPPLEFQEIKIAIFQAFMDISDLADEVVLVRTAITGALDISQSLPSAIKLAFVDRVMALGFQASTSALCDAIHFFKLCLHVIEDLLLQTRTALSDDHTNESQNPDKSTLIQLKIKLQLALSFAFNEFGQYEKALACIAEVERVGSSTRDVYLTDPSVDEIIHMAAVARFSISVRAKEWASAESSLRHIIKSCVLHSIALNCLQSLLHGCPTVDMKVIMEHYRMLCTRFPTDPEFNTTRISYIKAILMTSIRADEAVRPSVNAIGASEGPIPVSPTVRALELCGAMIQDHLERKHSLQGDCYQSLRGILLDRIKWHRSCESRHHWLFLIAWSDFFLKLVGMSTDETDMRAIVMINKAEALLQLSEYSAAREVALMAVNTVHSRKTLIVAFRTLLHVESAEATVQIFLSMQRKSGSVFGSGATAAQSGFSSGSNRVDDPEALTQFLLCSKVANGCKHISTEKREAAATLLLQEWLSLYVSSRAWRSCDSQDASGVTYFAIVSEVLQKALGSMMSRRKPDAKLSDFGPSAGSVVTPGSAATLGSTAELRRWGGRGRVSGSESSTATAAAAAAAATAVTGYKEASHPSADSAQVDLFRLRQDETSDSSNATAHRDLREEVASEPLMRPLMGDQLESAPLLTRGDALDTVQFESTDSGLPANYGDSSFSAQSAPSVVVALRTQLHTETSVGTVTGPSELQGGNADDSLIATPPDDPTEGILGQIPGAEHNWKCDLSVSNLAILNTAPTANISSALAGASAPAPAGAAADERDPMIVADEMTDALLRLRSSVELETEVLHCKSNPIQQQRSSVAAGNVDDQNIISGVYLVAESRATSAVTAESFKLAVGSDDSLGNVTGIGTGTGIATASTTATEEGRSERDTLGQADEGAATSVTAVKLSSFFPEAHSDDAMIIASSNFAESGHEAEGVLRKVDGNNKSETVIGEQAISTMETQQSLEQTSQPQTFLDQPNSSCGGGGIGGGAGGSGDSCDVKQMTIGRSVTREDISRISDIFGYPASLSDLSKVTEARFIFACSLGKLRRHILSRVQAVPQLVEQVALDSSDTSPLGEYEDLEWIADLSWNMGSILLPASVCAFVPIDGASAEDGPNHSHHPLAAVEAGNTNLLRELDAEKFGAGARASSKRLFSGQGPNQDGTAQHLGKTPSGDISKGSVGDEEDDVNSACRLLTAAEFFEAAEGMYASIPYEDLGVRVMNQALCLLMAAGARLDAGNFMRDAIDRDPSHREGAGGAGSFYGDAGGRFGTELISGLGLGFGATGSGQSMVGSGEAFDGDSSEKVPELIVSKFAAFGIFFGAKSMKLNLEKARAAAVKAAQVLRSLAGFDADQQRENFRKVAFVYEFTVACRYGQKSAKHFLETFKQDFLTLSALELMQCARISKENDGGTTELLRSLLNCALQVCHRESPVNYSLMGTLFVQLVELSPNRAQALEKIEEFDQLASSKARSANYVPKDTLDCDNDCWGGSSSLAVSDRELLQQQQQQRQQHVCDDSVEAMENCASSVFDQDDIDRITSLAFNHGVTLSELDQPELAEKFMSRALSLLRLASPTVNAWRSRMQEGYQAVLQKQADAMRKSANRTNFPGRDGQSVGGGFGFGFGRFAEGGQSEAAAMAMAGGRQSDRANDRKRSYSSHSSFAATYQRDAPLSVHSIQ